MPRKKSVKHSAQDFSTAADEIVTFLTNVSNGQSKQNISWLHNYAVIRLYREFESLMLDALVGAINNDTATISAKTGVDFPKHITDEVCEFLITRGGYFDFRGLDGLIKTLKNFVPDEHYLVVAVRRPVYKEALERLSALRNFAALTPAHPPRPGVTAHANPHGSSPSFTATSPGNISISRQCANTSTRGSRASDPRSPGGTYDKFWKALQAHKS